MDIDVGIFDSGIGGLTVYKKLKEKFPHLSFAYLSDTKRAPYGIKSKEEIQSICLENCKFFDTLGAKQIVIACHTASVLSYDVLSKSINKPIYPMHLSTLEELLNLPPNKSILILGTSATIENGFYQNNLRIKRDDLTIKAIACPFLVEYVEKQIFDPELLSKLIQLYEITTQPWDYILLACTHFPWLKKELQKILPSNTFLIDPADILSSQTGWESNYLEMRKKDLFFVHGNSILLDNFLKNNFHDSYFSKEIFFHNLSFFSDKK